MPVSVPISVPVPPMPQIGTRTALCLGISSVIPRSATDTGEYSQLSALTGHRTFVTGLASQVAAEAAR